MVRVSFTLKSDDPIWLALKLGAMGDMARELTLRFWDTPRPLLWLITPWAWYRMLRAKPVPDSDGWYAMPSLDRK